MNFSCFTGKSEKKIPNISNWTDRTQGIWISAYTKHSIGYKYKEYNVQPANTV